MLGDATGAVEDGFLVLRVDLRPDDAAVTRSASTSAPGDGRTVQKWSWSSPSSLVWIVLAMLVGLTMAPLSAAPSTARPRHSHARAPAHPSRMHPSAPRTRTGPLRRCRPYADGPCRSRGGSRRSSTSSTRARSRGAATPVGTLDGIRAHLDHLEWLGVDAIWLSPFFRSPMADFGYDVADYCDVDPLFGTLDDFDRLLADAHGRGLRVLLDWVPNHTSDQHPWFVEARAVARQPETRLVRLARRLARPTAEQLDGARSPMAPRGPGTTPPAVVPPLLPARSSPT